MPQTALPVLLGPLYLAGRGSGWHWSVRFGMIVAVTGGVGELAGAGGRSALAIEDL